MKIVCAGGGSGGHVTPVLAVINELKKSDSQCEAWFICDRGFAGQAKQLVDRSQTKIGFEVIYAGKLRRYHGVSAWRQLADIPTLFANIRDIFLLAIGFLQSLLLLARLRPDVVFTKGGFVCVPVGFAARLLRIPLVIHDSDAHPGLTNRLLAKFAAAIATGAPLSHYDYPKSISKYVGIPVNTAFHPSTAVQRAEIKKKLGYDDAVPLVFVTGGGLGAIRINTAMTVSAKRLSKKAQIVHLSGTKNFEAVKASIPAGLPRYEVLPFVDETMPLLVRAADIVVTRAGATTLFEIAAAARPAIIIPNPRLTSGHQLKNAAVYSEANAAVVLDEVKLAHQPQILADAIIELLSNGKERERLSKSIEKLARANAAKEVAHMILDVYSKSDKHSQG